MNNPIAQARVTINAPADKVWNALTDPSMIKQYMGGANVTSDWKVGSTITYAGEWNGQPYEDKGEILEIEPKQRLKSTHNEQIVTYDLIETNGSTDLRVTQENNPNQEMVEQSEKTWAMMLDGMKQLIEA